MQAKPRFIRQWLGVAACGFIALFAPLASATTSDFVAGGFNYALFDNPPRAILTLGTLANVTNPPRISGELTLELWAFAVPYAGLVQANYQPDGYRLASYPLGRLAPTQQFLAVNSGPVPYTPPPPGTWYVTVMVVEYTGWAGVAGGVEPRAYANNTVPLVIAAPAVATPVPGLWYDPAQPGTGYSINVAHGVLVLVVFSYAPDGTPQWYIATGPLAGTNPQVFSAPLQTYTGGTCVSCTGAVPPVPGPNAGSVFVAFTSPTTATVSIVPNGGTFFAGGRTANIVPASF